jgi:RNA polymerase sigma-70 factor (ECF subfamily)
MGDRSAFTALIERHLSSLYRFVARELRYHQTMGSLEPGELTPEEVVDEVLVQALRDMPGMPHDASFKGYLRRLALRVVHRAVRDSVRRRKVERVHLEDVVPWADDSYDGYYRPITWEEVIPDRTLPTPDEFVAFEETREELEQALNKLPATQRMVFILHAIEELSYREVAAMLALPVDEVRRLYHEAREALRRWLVERRQAGSASSAGA